MRLLALALAGLLVTACSSTQNFTMSSLAGPNNLAAMDSSVDCRNDDALAFALGATKSDTASHRLFGQFVLSAIYTDTGNTKAAAQAVDVATSDPTLNPDGLTRQQMQESADAVLEGIRSRRAEASGSRSC